MAYDLVEWAISEIPSAQPEKRTENTRKTHACDLISRKAAIDALWKALHEYEDKTEKQFQESEDLDVEDWILHRIFVQNMSDIDRQTILNLPPTQPELIEREAYIRGFEQGKTQGRLDALSAQPEHTNSCYTNSWCIDCKEYDTENKCCPRYSRVIKQTLDDAYRHGETEAEARFHAEIVRCKECKHHDGIRCFRWNSTIITKFDDYCSMAERKTDED